MGRLALVHSRSVRGGLSVPWRRAAAIAAAGVAALALLYVGARETPVFAVRSIEVWGAPADVRRAVEAAAEPVTGKSLVALDGAGLVRDLEALPSVRSVTYDRAFPSTLRIYVVAEHPVAVVHLGEGRWVVSERGRIIRSAPRGTPVVLPQFRLPQRAGIEPGSFVTEPAARVLLGALVLVPRRFPARIYTVRLEGGQLTFRLRATWGRPELRLGEPVDVAVKLASAALVLRSIPADERGAVRYVDASLPERVVVGSNPQPSGLG
ncbi:MAG TPA: FtsQ-type POTRA domain-containing protein [Gaiellaceae bacterium]